MPTRYPTLPLPADTNARLIAAYEATRRDASTRLGRARRPGSDSRLRRYLSKHLRRAREAAAEDGEELQRITILQQIFLDYLPSSVVAALDDVRQFQLTGPLLIRRLEALRQRYRLNPAEPEESDGAGAGADVVRIICSDGLLG